MELWGGGTDLGNFGRYDYELRQMLMGKKHLQIRKNESL